MIILKKHLEITSAGWAAVVYTDDDGGSGYGDHARLGYWYGTKEECEAVAPESVRIYPISDGSGSPPYDAATATGMYDAW